MAYNKRYYPLAMKHMNPELREQAIELANIIIERKLYPEHVAVPTAINAVKNWQRNGWL